MEYTGPAITVVVVMLFLLVIGVPIAWSLGFSSLLVGLIFYGSVFLNKIGVTTYFLAFNLAWTPLPLFTLMACIIAETTMGEGLYRAARAWFSRVPGGLVVTSIFGQAGMSAAMGTSAATLLAVGKVAVPEFERYKVKKGFGLGALVCGGVLGPLIPPSGTMIIYALLADAPLGRLFIAGIIPGIILAVMLSATAIFMCLKNPSLGGVKVESVPWSERFLSLRKIWPIIIAGLAVLGSIYFGIATPTEAGGFGAFIVLVIAVVAFGFRLRHLYRAMVETALLNATIMIILIGAVLFAYLVGSSNLAQNLAGMVSEMNIPSIWVVVMIMVMLLILGCFLDGLTIMMLTIPIFAPLVRSLGLDLIWFGVLYVTNMEIGLITPPMGINLFLARNTFNVSTYELLRGVSPFLICLVVFLGVTVAFPQLSTWLPNLMKGS
jgi:tripartite ATP-independent transporter DctM subunit